MQEAIRRSVRSDDVLETFSELAVKEPDLMRLVLQAIVAALVNVQSVEGVELKSKVPLQRQCAQQKLPQRT